MNEPLTDEELNLLFRYLDDELTEAELENFIAQLETNPALQEAFDLQLLMSSYLEEKNITEPAVPAELEPADAFLKRVSPAQDAAIPVVPLPRQKQSSKLAVAASVAALLLLSGLLYLLLKDRQQQNDQLVRQPKQTTLPATQQPQPGPAPTPDTITTDQLFADNNTDELLALQVPIAATIFSSEYQQQRYEKLAARTDASLKKKGIGSTTATAAAYLHFYQALANLKLNKPRVADSLLQQVIARSKADLPLQQQARWYLLLAYLKMGDRQQAGLLAGSISNEKDNPYRKKALHLKEALLK